MGNAKPESFVASSRFQIVDWSSFDCEVSDEDIDQKDTALSTSSSGRTDAAASVLPEDEVERMAAKLRGEMDLKKQAAGESLRDALRYFSSDISVLARSVRWRLTKNLARGNQSSGTDDAEDKVIPSSVGGEDTTNVPFTTNVPANEPVYHVYVGTDFVASAPISSRNQITCLFQPPAPAKKESSTEDTDSSNTSKLRICAFQHCTTHENPVSATKLLATAFTDPTTLGQMAPYLLLFVFGFGWLFRRAVCPESAGGVGGGGHEVMVDGTVPAVNVNGQSEQFAAGSFRGDTGRIVQ